ncbi:Vacuolar protein sorting-associated protein 13A [Phytophthora pseudosyringae]|uniref:Vacuolar protein sorting-associated protein 13A n=1 Tax=Phytophthora pseudosyringae TaxID=221518 RepID=A0A8T1VF81_9STRA|nr:Vacuolar protein sorting-associated protein 13A [Phytophthora pseudosyringae]
MFETLVTGLLTSALGSYIEPKCFSSDKINVAVWSGYVVLTELEVKPEVVAELPAVKLVRGLVGSIELKIPWNRLQSDSVVATVDDVYLLLRTEEDIDAVMRQMDEFTLKKKLLEELYAQAKRQEQTADGADAASGEDGFAARLVNKIIDNLELHIRRIHIRVEDHSAGDHPFALGLTIESVHVQSTNSNWQPSYVDSSKSNEPRIFKIVELNHLSVYCNPDCELQRDRQIDFETCSAEQFSSAFSRSIPKRFDDRHYHHMQLYPSQQQHHFLLKPIDASARLIVNRDVFDANVPKFEVDVNVSEVAFRLEESQYCDMLYLASALQIPDHYAKYQRYRKIRPRAAVFDEPAEWWKYAITSVIEDLKTKKQQWAWGFMKDRRDDRKRYVSLWQQKSRQLLELADVDYAVSDSEDNDDNVDENGDTMDDDDQGRIRPSPVDYANLPKHSSLEIDFRLEEIERRRSVEEVLFFRYLADLEVRKFQASRATRVRRRLPTPPTHKPQAFSDTESVDTEFTESSVPAEVRYRSWGAWMFGWTSKLATPSADGESGQTPHRIIPEVELRELFKILEEPSRRSKKRMHKHRDVGGQDDASDSESQMELSELYRVTLTLQRGSLTLASDPETNKTLLRDDPSYGRKYAPTEFLLGTFTQLQVAAVARDETVVVDVSLQSIEAFDESAESSAFSRLLSRKQTIHPSGDGDDVNVSKLSGVVFLMSYEMKPANSSADASLFVHMEPLEIVLSPTARCWGRLANFMDTPASLGLWEELEVASFNDIVNFKARTEAKLDYVMENRIALAVDFRIQAPVIIIPESDTDYNCARLVVDLGRINFRTDRLSQIDSEGMSMSSTGGPPSSRSVPGSLALLSPSHFRGVNPNTSFVQQLYDEAERGEGAIRWKEEFYDKFSLSVANIHVLLIPYGKTNRVQDNAAGNNGMNYPSVSLPPYLTDIYNEEQEYELVERFNINITVRMSILPLDATLTRFYVHADLPALTFNLSLEKYFQLVALAGRFSLANAEVPNKSRKYSDGGFYSPEDAYGIPGVGMPNPDDRYEAMRRGSFLSTSALKKFMLDDSESAPPSVTGASPDDAGDSDEHSSVDSDDTWFSITSGNLDQSASALSDDIACELERDLSMSDLTDSTAPDSTISERVPPRSERRTRKRPRPYTPGGTTKLLDRRLMVCSFTVPLISVQLKKPRSSAVSSYASYRYDTSDFDDDPADNGTILVKLQVEDFLDASGRSTQYLLFSCPTITAPFSIKAPLHRGGKFPGYSTQRKRSARQRERVISFQVGGTKSSDGSRSKDFAAPETLLELGFSSLSDQKTGKEVLRDVDLQLGSVQFNFDQSYVCSLLELFEESSSQLALVPASSRGGGDISLPDIDDGLPPPFELTPTVKQEYSMPVNLTESVRADLERARKNLLDQVPNAPKSSVMNSGNDSATVALKLGVRLHSVSVCFSDRGDSVASVAILDSQVQLATGKAGQIHVSGLVGDVKVFDLSSKKRQEDGLGISGAAVRGFEASSSDYIEIFGLDTSATFASDETRHVLSVGCLISTETESTLTATMVDEAREKEREKKKSSLSLSVQPVRLLAQPEFVESLANYVVDGPLRTHFLSKRAALSDGVMEREHTRTGSLGSDFRLAPRLSPISNRPPESLTPFFDAVDTSNREARQFNFEASSPPTPPRDYDGESDTIDKHSDHGDGSAKEGGDDVALILARILDNFNLDVKLFHPFIVLPSTPLKDIRVSLQSQPYRGIVVDFGTISIALRREESESLRGAPACSPYHTIVTVESLQVTSLADQTAILDRSGFQLRCSIPPKAMNKCLSGGIGTNTLPDIALDVEVYPVCVNVSETNVCLALEVFYEAIIPIFDTVQGVAHQIESYEGASVVDSASLPGGQQGEDGDLEPGLPGAAHGAAQWGQLTVNFLLEEFKIALISYSEAPHQFETWMKSVIDIPDEISSRESSGGASSAAQGRSYPQHFMGRRGSFPNEIPCCVIGEVALVALEANIALSLKDISLVDNQDKLQCDFSLQEAVVRDKIADSTEFLTHLFGPVPGALLERMESRTSIASDSSSFSFLSRDDILPPLLRPSTSQSSRLDVSSSQLCGRLTSKPNDADKDGSAIMMNSLELSVSSARLILLPRTLLRLEHFVLDVFLAASKKRSELELQRDEAIANSPPGVEGSAFVDADPDDNRGERQETRFTVPPLRPRNDSISESLKDDLNAVRSAFMSPLQRMLSSASAKEGRPPGSFTSRVIAEETGSGSSVGSKTKGSLWGGKAGDRKRLLIPQWKVDACFSNLQMWVVSSDRKADVAGCVLSSELVAKFDSVLDGGQVSTSSDCSELVAASVRLSKVEVLVGSPRASGTEQIKTANHSGSLVQNFEVDVQFALRQCFRAEDTFGSESSDNKSDENSDSNSGGAESGDNVVENSDDDAKAGPWINTSPTEKTDNTAMDLPELFLRDVPSEWQEWMLSEPTVRINHIISHIAYRDLPLLLKIAASLTSMLDAEKKIRNTFITRLKAAVDDLDWSDLPDATADYSEYAHYFGADDVGVIQTAGQDTESAPQYDVLTRASVVASGVQFRLINNIVDQASPVVEFDTKAIELLLRSESNSMVEVTARCKAEAKYQNLRLVTMEPLIEPWSVRMTLSQQQSRLRGLDDRVQLAVSPWKLDISSDVFLHLNLTDALIANLVAADRAWRWVINAGGDSREMTEYSTYWIRNNTGMPLRYWGASYKEHSLAPGKEEPLRFNKEHSESDKRDGNEKSRKGGRRNAFVQDRQLFIAVEEEYPSDSLSNIPRTWQSEAPIPVDQVDSRMYALVDFEADVTATRMRKCECVIDVLVERGCKYFVVRSTLILENQTSSDLEVEFVPPQRRSVSRSLRTGNAPQGHIIPIWKKVVKASSVVPVPVHIVSSGEGYVMVRPPEINATDPGDNTSSGILPKAYAKERVHLPLFDRGNSSANENMTHMETDESGQAQCTIKFRRLYSDRPVRPFMMTVCLSSASGALYHRTLSFHPPLIVHNLTAGPLDFCLATPSDWSPAVEAATLTNAGMNAGWETREQRLRERGTINAADSLIWHLSSEETPLELSVRMKGFDWSEPLELEENLGDLVRIKMKDLVSDAHLYVTAEIRMSKGHCRELFLYVPYWIVNLTGLKLEYEYEEERMGREHTTTLLAGQKRLDRDELLLKESQRAKAARRVRNPHLLHPGSVEDEEFAGGMRDLAQQSIRPSSGSPDRRQSERKRRHPRLLPSVPPVKGLLDLLPKTIEYDPRSLGQLEVLQACHSNYRLDRGCVRLRVSNERDIAALDARKESGQRKWSDPFVLDQAGTIGEIEADDYGANRKFSIGYSIIPAKGQYSRTKVIMLTPRFMLINTMGNAIEVCHSSSKMMTPSVIDMANASGSMPNSRAMSPVNPVVQLDAGAFADFHWTLRFAKTRTLRCRFAEYGWSWSGAVPLAESGEYAVRMRHESTRESKLVRVTLKLDSSCICVYFREERTTTPPYRVENYSLETLRTHQHHVRRSEILLPHHSLDYAWDEPTEERLLVVDMLPSAAGDNSRPLRIGSFDLDKIQRYPDALGGTLGIEISTDGPTRVLRFTDTRLRGEKAVPASTQVPHDVKPEVAESSALQLLQRFVTAPTVHAAMHLQGVGISIVDSAPKELVYMSVSGITLEVLVTEDDRNNSGASIAGSAASLSRLERETRPRILACCLEVNDVQVDNQLQVTPYPVLLRFSNPNSRSRIVNGQTVSIPVLQVGLVKHDEYAGIEFIRHFSVSVLPVHIRVDGALLYQILPLLMHAKIYGSGGNTGTTTKKRAVVLVNGDSSSDEVTRAAHSHLLLKDFNASLEVPVKVLEAAQKDGTTSAGPTSGPTTPTMKMVARRNSSQQQISPRQNQHTALAAEIQRYTAAKYGSLGVIDANDEQKKLYFEEFHIDPIRATVSFSFGDSAGAIVDGHLSSLSHAAALTDSSSREPSVITVGPLRLILNAIGTSLTKIANAPFQLKALHIHNSFVQPDALATRLASHYQSEALRQAYVILGSVDVLGNPMIAWKNLRSGFQDFISEPAHGLSQRSPQAFAFGVGRGSLSLVRASVYTFLDFNTRILTAFSLGLSEACLKLDDYTGYPATRHIFQGLVQGVSGVVVAPIHSFEVNGVRGVLPGLVAGAFGVVLKPLLGFSLATATTAVTLRDAVDPNTKALLVRVRPPRHIDLRTKRLKVYSYVESLGEEIVGKIRGGRYRGDGYLGHVDLKATHQCFLVTRKRILFLNVKGTASAQTTKYDVEWELLAEEVVMVDCSRTPSEQIVTIYYMEDEFRAASGAGRSTRTANGSNAVTTNRRRTPGVPRGMFLQKHEVALPDTKVLFVRAMLQQQERSLLTKMNSYAKDGTPHHASPIPPLARTNSMELSTACQPQQPYMPQEYPIFRLPPSLHQTRSFANLAQTHNHYKHHQSNTTNEN